jgi:hypothetical protein
MHDNKPNNFYIKHFFIIFQIKKLQQLFDTFVPHCIVSNKRSGRTLTLISFIISFVKHRTRCTTRLATTGGRKFSVVIASTSLAGSQTGESSPAERARERAMLLTANTARLTDVPSSGHYFFLFFSEGLDSVSKKKKNKNTNQFQKRKVFELINNLDYSF